LSSVKAKLYALSMSHPARAAGLMLRHKGIDHEIVNLVPGSQPVVLRLRGFRGPTVPALQIDGRKVQGSLQISRALEELKAEPPLFPADPKLRTAVEDAERWGEAEYQPLPRRLFRWAITRDQDLREALARAAGLPTPSIVGRATVPVAWYFARASQANDDSVRSDLTRLPHLLDHVDELIAEGVIGDELPNAADFQIATTTRVLMNFSSLRPLLEGRPAVEHAERVVPRFGAEFPLRLPQEWVPAPPPRA
jgi:glutathione S-transferase